MPSKKQPPRKKPQQARAQQTVNAILEATVQVLEREGPEAATTTRIAEVAGVSVGTLYQYFSHRDAIFDALQEREFTKAIALTQEILSEDNLPKSPREVVCACVEGMLQLHSSYPGVHRVLAMEGLRTAKADRLQSFDLRIIGLVRHFLSATGASVRRKNVDAAAFIAFQCVRAVMLASLLETSPGLNDATMVEELVDLLMRYLVEEEATAVAPAPESAVKTAARA
ncbi:MAG: TetR/AcrR family transcriptional regulator [Labilithrix sp.]|nr:TetR/AcrR family transcriptional regulator [Labilithrix sp.]MCW5810236.1 TetR/AcrR family transcriptional regulator [Labilithrix sp.]